MDNLELMNSINLYWKKHNIFQKSVEGKSTDMQVFNYDWPPFASWEPHYWHWLTSTIKDLIWRYKSMKWYRVVRNWWWDCHWLPVEKYVEKKLWIDGKKDIEKIWIKKFVEECRNTVKNVNENWKVFIDNLWRWADIDHAYFTMDLPFMESVIWVFKKLYERDLVYKWFKIQWYCPSCATWLSNSEINDWYKDRQDPSVTVKMKLESPFEQKKIEEKYETESDDWTIKYVRAFIKNEKGQILYLFHKKKWFYAIPGWKIDKWETEEKTLERELKEELWVSIKNMKFIWKNRMFSNSKEYRLSVWSYYEVEIDWNVENLETEKHVLYWADIVDYDNELWFAIKIENNLIIDEDLLISWKFCEMYWYKKWIFIQKDKTEKLNNLYSLVWTTTPWTLPSNMFLAVGENITYSLIYDKQEQEYYVIWKDLIKKYYKNSDDYFVIHYFYGWLLSWLNYVPIFDYVWKTNIDKKYKSKFFQVLLWDFVSTEDWTWIVHIAPAFGEDDFNVVTKILPQEKSKEWLFLPVDDYWEFTELVSDYKWKVVYEANKDIIKFLKEKNILVKQQTVQHSYPHCWRCDTPLIYKAMEAWFIKEHEIANDSVENIKNINFVPATIQKRFHDVLVSAPDWNISRNRFWWSPLPIWENIKDENDRIVIWTLDELYQKTKKGSSNITKHLIIRHWHTDYNNTYKCDLLWKASLDKIWKKQAEDLSIYLEKKLNSDTIIVLSPVKRTFETILFFLQKKYSEDEIKNIEKKYSEIVEKYLDLIRTKTFLDYIKDKNTQKTFEIFEDIYVDFRITDIFTIDWQDRDNVRFLEHNDWDLIRWNKKYDEKITPNWESVKDTFERTKDYIEDISKKFKTKTIVTVSHCDTIVLLAKVFKNFDYYKKRYDRRPNNAEVLKFFWDNDRNLEIDLHRPYVDNYLLNIDWKNYKRIPEVFDCWFESWSMPYWQINYLWEQFNENNYVEKQEMKRKYWLREKFPYPSDYIIEWLDQTRWWFRTLHILWNWIIWWNSFKNVIINWLVLAEDWKKMSKKLKNYPDPYTIFKKYWSDSYRIYMLSSPSVKAEPFRFSEKWVEQIYKDFVSSIKNSYKFFETYANVDWYKFLWKDIYFIRHADAEWTNSDAELTLNWINSMNDKKFIEKIIRINPEVIYSSYIKRALITAKTIQQIIKKYLSRDIEIIVDEWLGFSEKVLDSYWKILNSDTNQRILLVWHNYTLSTIWNEYYNPEKNISKKWDNLEIIKLPSFKIKTDLDRRILAELNKLWLFVEEKLDKYIIDISTKELLVFVDKLTNWYIRRNRRIFWKSWMDEEKLSAYNTLFTVLNNFMKIIAPFSPFISEYIFKNLQQFTKHWFQEWISVHLESFPVLSRFFIDNKLLDEIKVVREIISLWLSLRAKNNIRVKQPLQSLEIKLD